MIEQFFAQYQYTVNAFIAVGTIGAVIVSLWLSYNSQKTKLLVSVSMYEFFQKNKPEERKEEKEEKVVATIINKGRNTAYINSQSFFWKNVFIRKCLCNNLMNNPIFQNGCIGILPGKRVSIELTEDTNGTGDLKKNLKDLVSEKKSPKCFYKFTRLYVCTEDGSIFKAKLLRNFKDEFLNDTDQ